MNKRMIFSVLASTMCLTMLAGCGAGTNSDKSADEQEVSVTTDSEKGGDKVTVDKKTDKDHEHDYKKTVTTEATCTSDGEAKLECECGDTKTEKIEATGHAWKDATCNNPKTCSKCGKTEGNALGHKWGDGYVSKEQTCEEKGSYSYKCTRCGEVYTAETPALGHNYYKGKCSRCDKDDPNYVAKAEHVHSYEDVYQEVNGTKQLMYKRCSGCGDTKAVAKNTATAEPTTEENKG